MSRSFFLFTILLMGNSRFISAAEGDSVEFSRPSFTIFHEFGDILRGTDFETNRFKDTWLQRSGVWLNFTATKNQRIGLDVLIGGTYWSPTYNENADINNSLRYFTAAAPRINVTYAFGDPKVPFLKADFGIFQYKYNENVRNLGEYLFRTTAYPGLVYTGGLTLVENNKAQVAGLKLTHSLGKTFSHDLLLTLETDQLPFYDLNASYLAKYNWRDVIKVGGGIKFARLLPIRPSITNPDVQNNHYYTYNDTTYIDNKEYYTFRLAAGGTSADSSLFLRGQALADSLAFYQLGNPSGGVSPKSFAQALDSLRTAEGMAAPASYSNYDGSSITPMAFFAFDPKPLMNLGILGPKDLTLYGEAALLGIKDYPILYESKKERTVMMIGFNIPTFKVLDVLSIEFEHFGSRIPNSNQLTQRDPGKINGVLTPLPQPSIYGAQLGVNGYSPDDWKRDDNKWSVFARRSLGGFSLGLQVASDNARGWAYPSGRKYWALFRKPSDWYWMLKLSANI